MADRFYLCWAKCCRTTSQEKDDGEWIQPITNTKNKRHISKTQNKLGKTGSKRELDRTSSVKWADLEVEETRLASISEDEEREDDSNVSSTTQLSIRSTEEEEEEEENDDEEEDGEDFEATKGRGSSDSLLSSNKDAKDDRPRKSRTSMLRRGIMIGSQMAALGKAPDSSSPKGRDSFLSQAEEMKKNITPRLSMVASGMMGFGGKKDSSIDPTSLRHNHRMPGGKAPITSIATLADGFFLTASIHAPVIKMYKTVDGDRVEFVKDFNGHKSGITALVILDKKGRFLSAGQDKTVRLWDSRFNCKEDLAGEGDGFPVPKTLLATFDEFKRWVHSVEVLNEGSFVRPTDDLDMAMVTAMAKKTALEGANSVQRAALEREIIECSGSFVTASKNQKDVIIWNMTVAGKKGESSPDGNVAEANVAHVLKHDFAIEAIAAMNDLVLTGDITGDVYMWKRLRSSLWGYQWTKLHKFTPRKNSDPLAHWDDDSNESIVKLCLLGSDAFVSGTKKGQLRVWDIETADGFEVRKKKATSLKMSSSSILGIQKLPLIQDSATGEYYEAFSVLLSDGCVASLSWRPRVPSIKEDSIKLKVFQVFDKSLTAENGTVTRNENAIGAISISNDKFWDPVLIAGDGGGDIHLLTPKWDMRTVSTFQKSSSGKNIRTRSDTLGATPRPSWPLAGDNKKYAGRKRNTTFSRLETV
eukprot:CAMPEP_0183714526 /NCGR_PEP_ID=MMETSP0737-20130205/9015_1 /TAXON_ID=385413 /ORGANISM="Thalassiosira miniscula, Strain CCMP1093" /LENGTH=698 /DNA_ID=CAMNT_0025943461 /DNA_START=123 /DNA_END=2219 /DNA_ORIENTATION=+